MADMDTKTELIGGGTIALIALGVAAFLIFKSKFETTADNVNNAVSGTTGLIKTTTDETGQTIQATTDLYQQQMNFLTEFTKTAENALLQSLKNKVSGISDVDIANKVYDRELSLRKEPDNAPTEEQAKLTQKTTTILKDYGFVPKGQPMSISQDNAAANVAAQKKILATVAKDEKSAIIGQWYKAPSGLTYKKVAA